MGWILSIREIGTSVAMVEGMHLSATCRSVLSALSLLLLAHCASEDVEENASAYERRAGTVVGGKDGVVSIDSVASPFSKALGGGGLATLSPNNDSVEFLSPTGARPVRVSVPSFADRTEPGPGLSAIVLYGQHDSKQAGDRQEMDFYERFVLVGPSGVRATVEGEFSDISFGSDESIVWLDQGNGLVAHRLRGGKDTAVVLESNPRRTAWNHPCDRFFVGADRESFHFACFASGTTGRIQTFDAQGRLVATAPIPEGIDGDSVLKTWDAKGRWVFVYNGQSSEAIGKNIPLSGFRFDPGAPKGSAATEFSMQVYKNSEWWQPSSLAPLRDGSLAVIGTVKEAHRGQALAVVKLDETLTLDTTFDGDGAMSFRTFDAASSFSGRSGSEDAQGEKLRVITTSNDRAGRVRLLDVWLR